MKTKLDTAKQLRKHKKRMQDGGNAFRKLWEGRYKPEYQKIVANDRADALLKDILFNHLPRVKEGLEKGYVDENQILIMFDHAVRIRMLRETGAQ